MAEKALETGHAVFATVGDAEHLQSKDPKLIGLAARNAVASKKIYCSIRVDQIRLVLLHGGQEALIRCSLTTGVSRAAPKYEALSYVWGSQENPRTIHLDGEAFLITENLGKALVRLRLPRDDRMLWIDALSIDQSNIPERNMQVERMPSIYAGAQKTLLWLGPGDPLVDVIFQLLEGEFSNTVEGESTLSEVDDLVSEEVGGNQDSGETIEKLGSSEMQEAESNSSEMEDDSVSIASESNSDEGFHVYSSEMLELLKPALVELTRLPYWSRVWVVQEMIYSKSCVLIHGKHSVSFQQFAYFWRSICKSADILLGDQRDLDSVANAFLYTIQREIPLEYLQPDSIRLGSRLSLTAWLTKFCKNRNCSDPRDIVFGFHFCFKPLIRELITVDYTKTVRQLFVEVTKAFVFITGNLDIIGQVETFDRPPSGVEMLPSWVPSYAGEFVHAGSVDWNECRTTKGSPRCFYRIINDGSILHAQGICIGTCERQSRVFHACHGTESEAFGITFGSIFEHLIKCKHELGTRDQDMVAFIAAFIGPCGEADVADDLRVWLASGDISGEHSRDQLHRIFETRRDEIVAYWITHNTHCMFKAQRAELEEPGFSNDKTSTQPLYGIGTPRMREGDRIYIVLGCTNPKIVRQIGRNHILVGSAFMPQREGVGIKLLSHPYEPIKVYPPHLDDLYFI